MRKTIAILGAGSWGTAIAIHLAHYGNDVLLWAHDSDHVRQMDAERCNTRYLPGIAFPAKLTVTADLQQCLLPCAYLFIAVPSHAFAELLTKITTVPPGLAWLTKGLDPRTHHLLSTLVLERFGQNFPFAILSGPSFAREVAQLLPTAVTLAGNNTTYQKSLQKLLHHKNLRVYLSHDFTGVQICGAVKNVLAIACGISDGLGYGANAKAALITRGLAEMTRLGTRLGAREETFRGLAGVGDLVLTCTDNQSRNRRFGLKLGEGLSTVQAEKDIGQVVEGKYNAAQICALAHQLHIDMPICEQVHQLLIGKTTPEDAFLTLMRREIREE
jgi:glycerol-3-phosphate dehydrogenase (NAD(P)+)